MSKTKEISIKQMNERSDKFDRLLDQFEKEK